MGEERSGAVVAQRPRCCARASVAAQTLEQVAIFFTTFVSGADYMRGAGQTKEFSESSYELSDAALASSPDVSMYFVSHVFSWSNTSEILLVS